MIKLDYKSFAGGIVSQGEIEKYYSQTTKIVNKMQEKAEMLDWFDIETTVSKQELIQIKTLAMEIKNSANVFIVVGIGGSYLGAKAIIEAFAPYFGTQKPEILFAGFDLDDEYLQQLLTYVKNKSVYVNVISKSGTTMETTIAFNKIFDYMKKHFPLDYSHRIIATTDETSGALRQLSIDNNFRTLNVPKNIGGRFSVLSPVGLLPIAVSGLEVDEILKGAKKAKKYLPLAVDFAIIRHILFKNKRAVEAFTFYESKFASLAGWYQQLFAETQGKNGKGIISFANQNTTNLHSIGQFLQDGTNIIFETALKIKNNNKLNNLVLEQVCLAHEKGNTPSVIIELDNLNYATMGEFIQFCFYAAAIGGYLLEINPFNQPGVEEYKKLVKQKLAISKLI